MPVERETWPRCPEATTYFEQLYRDFADANPPLVEMEARFLKVAGTRIQNLIDHWILPEGERDTDALTALGLVETTLPEGDRVWSHPEARLPRLRFKGKITTPRLALLVENIPRFFTANGLTLEVCHGDPESTYQCAHYTLPHGELMPITRNGYAGYAPGTLGEAERKAVSWAQRVFQKRSREGDEAEVLAQTQALVEKVIEEIGQDRATDEFFVAERAYYLTRNRAALWQYGQQQVCGFGWANHDHHTYRCSRESFPALIRLWLTLGFQLRERFYAGAEAGWGAQIVEHPVSRVIIFSDVDMAPEELGIDYANTTLAPRQNLGTIGLWCALHGISIAHAGMHHIECEFDYAQVHANLEAAGHPVMAPFTDLPMLKQAFTVAEMWPVAPERFEPLIARGQITPEQAERFRTQGAAGSHLEILQRWEGFKGFSKTGVSAIIRATDARNRQ